MESLGDWVERAHILRLSWSPTASTVRTAGSASTQVYWTSLFAADPTGSVLLIEEIGERSDLVLTMDRCVVTIWHGGASRAAEATLVVDRMAAAAARDLVEEKFVGEQAFQDLGVVAVVVRLDALDY